MKVSIETHWLRCTVCTHRMVLTCHNYAWGSSVKISRPMRTFWSFYLFCCVNLLKLIMAILEDNLVTIFLRKNWCIKIQCLANVTVEPSEVREQVSQGRALDKLCKLEFGFESSRSKCRFVINWILSVREIIIRRTEYSKRKSVSEQNHQIVTMVTFSRFYVHGLKEF